MQTSTSKKPFFFRLEPAKLLAEMVQVTDRSQWITQLLIDLTTGTPTTPLSASMIQESIQYSEVKRAAVKKRWERQDKQVNTDVIHSDTRVSVCNTSNSNRKDIKKKTYQELVDLTEVEYQKLITQHGYDFTMKCISKLSSYKLSSGKKYKSDFGAINTWVVDEIKKTHRPDTEIFY